MKNFGLICIGLIFNINVLSAINADIKSYVFTQDSYQYVEVVYFIPTTNLVKSYNQDSSYNFKVSLTVLLKKDKQIVKVEKFMLTSPNAKISQAMLHNLRWKVGPGTYEIESQLQDARNTSNEISLINSLEVSEIPQQIYISDIQLFGKCTSTNETHSNMFKNGFIYEPLAYQLLDKNQNILISYIEVNNLNKYVDQRYILKYELYQQDSLSFTKTTEWFKSKNKSDLGIVLYHKDISALPSGHYKLMVSVLNNKGNVVDSKHVEFDRLNPFWDRLLRIDYANRTDEAFFSKLKSDSIHYYLKALNAILPSTDRDVLSELDREDRLIEQRMFLYKFWSDIYGDKCVAYFQNFMKNVIYADRNFVSGMGYGFESDRGITFLKYGAPLEVIKDDNDNGAFPYEIWKYDKLATGQTNVKFLFYNPDLAGANYILLHTNCYGGRFNNKWEIELYRKVKEEFDGDNLSDATHMKKSINRHAREYFDN
ncbi:MAG: GWxTD domain-containing protein [Saprospiraceae bacterium]